MNKNPHQNHQDLECEGAASTEEQRTKHQGEQGDDDDSIT